LVAIPEDTRMTAAGTVHRSGSRLVDGWWPGAPALGTASSAFYHQTDPLGKKPCKCIRKRHIGEAWALTVLA
jgi:hypothetical protein